MTEVAIFDELVLPADAVDGWLEAWEAGYLPGARSRGLELGGVWRGATEDPDRAAVVVHWTVPTVAAFFASRGRAATDPEVRAFWRDTDRIAISRDRRVLGAVTVTA